MNLTRRIRSALRPMREEDRAAAYLNESTSLIDLERRQREIDQGIFRPRNFGF